MAIKPQGYCLEINLTKTKWVPKVVDEIPKAISYAFEKNVTLDEIQPMYGTDHLKSWPLKDEADIKAFMNASSMMREAFAEKLIKFRHPGYLMPKSWAPKKIKILCRGDMVSKFFGEDEVGTRNVETSLKIYDCGHFYLKQTLPGSGPTPYWTIFEGKWEQKETGIRLEYHIRYSWQSPTKDEKDVSIEAQPPGLESSMAWVGETEQQLNGTIPAIVGEDKFCRVEICREPDKVEKNKLRWNEELMEKEALKEAERKQELEGEAGEQKEQGSDGDGGGLRKRKPQEESSTANVRGGASSSTSTSASSSGPSSAIPSASGKAVSFSPDTSTNSNSAAVGSRGSGGPAVTKTAEKSDSQDDDQEESDSEPMWPVYVGLGFFSLVMLLMAWLWWEDFKRKLEAENAW